MRLIVVGAGGRMGQALAGAVIDHKNLSIAGAVDRPGSDAIGKDIGTLCGRDPIGVTVSDDPLPLFANAEGVLDFTTPAATVQYAGLAAQARIVHVIGTTGLSPEDEEKIKAASRHAVIIKSGNMSLGVNLLAALVKKAAAALDEDWDIEIMEMHHRHKVDAPSGTALMFGEAAAAGRGIALNDHSERVRDGHPGARGRGNIGFAVRRGGSVIGEHTVTFAGDNEMLEITHRAFDRGIFARGALKAAQWGHGRKPGLYAMTDVLGI